MWLMSKIDVASGTSALAPAVLHMVFRLQKGASCMYKQPRDPVPHSTEVEGLGCLLNGSGFRARSRDQARTPSRAETPTVNRFGPREHTIQPLPDPDCHQGLSGFTTEMFPPAKRTRPANGRCGQEVLGWSGQSLVKCANSLKCCVNPSGVHLNPCEKHVASLAVMKPIRLQCVASTPTPGCENGTFCHSIGAQRPGYQNKTTQEKQEALRCVAGTEIRIESGVRWKR